MTQPLDLDKNGIISKSEIETSSELLELQLRESKAETQKNMAWTAIVSMIIFTSILFSPFISDAKISALSDLLGLFYIAQASVVGAYMGVTAWLSKSVNTNLASSASYSNYAMSSRCANVASARQVPQPNEPIL